MKRTIMMVTAATILSGALPVFAAEPTPAEVNCAKECGLLLKDCNQQADSIQQRIEKLQVAIAKYGADPQQRDMVKRLKGKLEEAKELLSSLEAGGGR